MRTLNDLIEIEALAGSAYAEAMVEIDQIMATDPRVRSLAHYRNKRRVERAEIRECLEDFAAGCKLPEQLAFLRYTPQSTHEVPQWYNALKYSNEVHRRWSRINDEVERYAEQLRATGTVVE